MNEHEAMGGEPIDHLVDHAFAAKEDRPFLGFERPQAGIGIFRPGRAARVRASRDEFVVMARPPVERGSD